LLPAGPLREPISRRSDFTVVTAAQMPPGLSEHAQCMQLAGDHAERLSDRAQHMPLRALAGAGAITAAAGIGNPERFFAMLRGAGLQFAEMPLPDHYDFSDNPFIDVAADIILITEKDAVKCGQIERLKNDPRLWVVPVTARIDGALDQQIVEKLRGRSTA
jgi:tetraacyldisaccharide 4'-kinase